MKIPIYPGQTSVNVDITAIDSSSTTGNGLGSFNGTTSGTTAYYHLTNGTASVSISLSATGTLGTWNSGCLMVVDGTNMKGVLQFSIPNAALPPVPGQSVFVINNTNVTMTPIRFELFSASTASAYTGVNVVTDNATSMRTSNVIQVNGSTSAASALSYAANDGNNFLSVNVRDWNAQQIAGVDTNGYPKVTIKSGVWTGEISLSSGVVNTVGSVTNATVVVDNATSTRNSNVVTINGSSSAASALSFAANDSHHYLMVDVESVQGDATAAGDLGLMAVAYAGGDFIVDTRFINGSASGASALSFASNDANHYLKVDNVVNSSTTVVSTNVTQINGSANAAANLSFFPAITTTASMFGVTTIIDSATSIRNSNMLSINGSTSAATALAFATNDGNNFLSVNVRDWNGSQIAGVDTSGYPKVTIKAGQGSGEISLAAGVVNSVGSVTANSNGCIIDNATTVRNVNATQINGSASAASALSYASNDTNNYLKVDAVINSGSSLTTNQAQTMADLKQMIQNPGSSNAAYTVTALENAGGGGGTGGTTTITSTIVTTRAS